MYEVYTGCSEIGPSSIDWVQLSTALIRENTEFNLRIVVLNKNIIMNNIAQNLIRWIELYYCFMLIYHRLLQF
jgi:hypothetical protein